MKTKVIRHEGVRVRVRLDEQSGPITLTAGCWKGGDAERITRLALNDVTWRLQYEAERRKKAAHDAIRTAQSAKKRREKADDHWTLFWLEGAHKLHPDYGAERLALEACRHVEKNRPDIPAARRKEITEYRARQYLKTARGK